MCAGTNSGRDRAPRPESFHRGVRSYYDERAPCSLEQLRANGVQQSRCRRDSIVCREAQLVVFVVAQRGENPDGVGVDAHLDRGGVYPGAFCVVAHVVVDPSKLAIVLRDADDADGRVRRCRERDSDRKSAG